MKQTLSYGGSAVAPGIVPYAGRAFVGWNRDFSCVTRDMQVSAVYCRLYTVVFSAGDHGRHVGGGGMKQTVEEGGAAHAPGILADVGWKFVGWDAPLDAISGNITITAQYERSRYTVSFVGDDRHGRHVGGGDMRQTLEYGRSAIAPKMTAYASDGWMFLGWDVDFSFVTSNMVVTAEWANFYYTSAVEAENLILSSLGDADWKIDNSTYKTASLSLRSGAIGDGESTTLKAIIEGSGQLSFSWKISCEPYYDGAYLVVDGEVVLERSGYLAGHGAGCGSWEDVSIPIEGSGTHVIQWVYAKDGEGGSSGSDCLWVDGVDWR